MTEKTYPALLLILAATVISPSSLAQGGVEQQRCPNAEKGSPDGNGGGNTDQFTYESWVDDDNDKDGRHFRRCIENQANKAIWTHWNGVLSSSWISVGHRLYGSTFVTRGEVNPHKTDLWWGDNKNNRIVPEAKCYKGENSCEQEKVSSAGQFVMVQWPRPGGVAKGLSEELATALEMKKDFSIRSYREFFVPADAEKPNENLFKFAISVTSPDVS